MNGHNCVIDRLRRNERINGIEITVTAESDKYDYDLQPVFPEPFPDEVFAKGFLDRFPVVPKVFTGISRPKPSSLWFIKDRWVKLIQGADCSDELFAAWYAAAVNASPSDLISQELYESERELEPA